MPPTATLVVAHADALVRDALRLACRRADIDIVDEVVNYSNLLRVCAEHHPDVALAGDRLGGLLLESTVDVVVATGTKVVVLSGDASHARVVSLLEHDVSGYFSFGANADEIARGILAVAQGGTALDPLVVGIIVDQWRRMREDPMALGTPKRPLLTPRELEVLDAMAEGLSTKAVAERLGIKVKTVENHKVRIFEKLGVRTHGHAVTVAFAMGLVTP